MKDFPIHTNDDVLNSAQRIRRDTLEEYNSYSVVSGTLNPRELWIALTRELYNLDRHGRYAAFCEVYFTYTGESESEENETQAMIDSLPELIEALDSIAQDLGPYYFGPHWGDGADMGFWPIESAE